MSKKKVLIIGTTPPPYGGVSVHVYNLLHSSSEKYEFFLLDYKRNTVVSATDGKLNLLSAIFLCEIVHIHVSHWSKIIFAMFFKLLFKKIVYTHHNSISGNSLFFKFFSFWCDKLLFVNFDILDNFLFDIPSRKTKAVPAFIPSKSSVNMKIPDFWMDKIKTSKYFIIGNCSRKNFLNEKEVYGFDLFYSVFERIKFEKNILIILFDPSGDYAGYFSGESSVVDFSTNSEIHIVNGRELSFLGFLSYADLYCRPTRTDGDSISIREAIASGVNVLASDANTRPSEVFLFETGNVESMYKSILECMTCEVSKKVDSSQENYFKIIDAYNDVLG